MGLSSISSLILIQESVPPSQRGSATASNMFARNIGNTLGAAILGAVLNYGLHRDGVGVSSDRLQRLLSGEAHAAADDLGPILHQSLH